MIIKQFIKKLIPNQPGDQVLLDRPLCCAPREDFHIYRLVQSHRLAPCHHELSAAFSLMGFIGPGMTFVDVGANIGLYATLFASVGERVGFDVVAVEPNPPTFARLQKTLANYSNCTLHNVGCSDRAGRMILQDQGDSLSAKLVPDQIQDDATTGKTFEVEIARLDALLGATQGPLVVKIDVEGHAREVLAGADTLFQNQRIVALLLDGAEKNSKNQLPELGFVPFDGPSLRPTEKAYNHLYILASAFPAAAKGTQTA